MAPVSLWRISAVTPGVFTTPYRWKNIDELGVDYFPLGCWFMKTFFLGYLSL